MSRDLYDLLALAGRYVFAALMVLIVLRAWRITIIDNRRAGRLRQLAPQTGLSGELVVLDGGEKAPNGARYPVIREGIIGSSRLADVRIRHSSVRRVHAFFELTEEGLKLRTHANAEMSRSWEESVRELLLKDGDEVEIGGVQLLLVLSGAQGSTQVQARRAPQAGDDLFEVAADEPAPRTATPRTGKAGRRTAARRARDPYDDEAETTLADDLFAEAPARQGNARPARARKRGEGLYSLEEYPEPRERAPRRRAEVKKRSSHKSQNPDEDIWL